MRSTYAIILSALAATASGLVLNKPVSPQPTPTANPVALPTIRNLPLPIDPSAETYEYFKQAEFDPHYDPRFASAPLPYSEQKEAIQVLMQTCLATLADLGVDAWLMKGSLLGWWWGQRVLPWATTGDIQISENGLNFLSAYYNMTLFFYQYTNIPTGRRFRLEINPHSVLPSPDAKNPVDARWTDLQTGLSIDISALRYLKDAAGEPTHLMEDKSGARFAESEIFPLKETMFEGVNAMIPHGFKEVLEGKYGKEALVKTEHEGHVFEDEGMMWTPKDVLKKQGEL